MAHTSGQWGIPPIHTHVSTIYWDNGINAPTDTLCFVEFNPNHEEDERVCIGAYRSNQDDPTYYAPYMAAERNANNE